MVQQHSDRGLSCSRCWELLQSKGPCCPSSFHFALSPLFRNIHWQQLLQLNSFPIQFTGGFWFFLCFVLFPPNTNFSCFIYNTVQKESSTFLDIEIVSYISVRCLKAESPFGTAVRWFPSRYLKKKGTFDSHINMLKDVKNNSGHTVCIMNEENTN